MVFVEGVDGGSDKRAGEDSKRRDREKVREFVGDHDEGFEGRGERKNGDSKSVSGRGQVGERRQEAGGGRKSVRRPWLRRRPIYPRTSQIT